MPDLNVDADLQVATATVPRQLSVEDFKTTATGTSTEATLAAVLAELAQKLEAGQEVALTASTLAALESIYAVVTGTVTVSNFPASQPVSGSIALDAPTLAALESIQAQVAGTVALDAGTLAALEAITVSGSVALDAGTLAALESVTAAVTGTVALDAPTLAALESVTAAVTGTVSVSNLPATQPVSGTVTVSNPTVNPETGLAKDATLTQTRDRLPAALDGGALPVADVFTGGEALADQAGDGTVKTFTFSSPVDLVWVRCVGGAGRADPFGGTPTLSLGIYCAEDEPNPMTVRTSVVKAISPAGTIVLWGYRG